MTGHIYPADMTTAHLDAKIAEVRAAQKYGREHPFEGVCGEDDARGDYLRDLEAERLKRLPVWPCGQRECIECASGKGCELAAEVGS